MSMRYPGGFIASTPVTANYPSGVWTQAQAIPYQAQNVWTRDQFWPYTTLLLQGDGAVNGAQNNTFLDSSSNNFTITRNGNTTQGSFTPYEQDGYWSNYFDGNGDYLTAPNNTALDLSTGDFTVECWFYVTSVAVARPLFGRNNGNIATPSDLQYGMYLQAGGSVVVRPYQGGTDYTTVIGTAAVNAWNHVALVRTGNTFYGFLNGVRGSTSQTISGALNTGSWLTYIGGGLSSGLGNDWMLGYISNVRIVKGTALYTSSFTPSAAPLTAVTNTSLLTCQSNRFRDNSTNNFAITSFGDTSVQAFQPFPGATTWSASVLGGSGYFDGTGDFLQVADAAAMELGSGNWTIELWVNTLNNTQYSALFTRDDGGVTAGSYVILLNTTSANGIVTFWSADVNGFSAAVLSSGSVSCRDGAWHHIAVVRNSNTLTMYIDGVSTSTASYSGAFGNTAQPIKIGSETGYSRDYTGYMGGVRLVVGTAVYTSNFTPPTTPLTAVTNTQLLLNFTNAGIYDNSMMNNLETVGNAQVSTSVVKYGTGSMAFDGSGDWLVAPSRATTSLEGDFTIEGWVYLSSTAAAWPVITIGDSSGASGIELYRATSNGKWRVYSSNTARIDSNTSTGTGSWVHLAVVRLNGVVTLYVNGVSEGSTWSTTSTFSGAVYVGAEFNGGSVTVAANGYIDDLRITKSARYLTTFTPPIARLPAQ